MKKRILLVSEATFLPTGYGVYGHEILKRLHATGKYEIAELAAYAGRQDPRCHEVPWTIFPNLPDPGNQEEVNRYNSVPTNQFGEWRFEEACLAFRPDIVFDFRDPWSYEFEERSPFRRFFHWAIMPTVDSAPSKEDWLSSYMQADAVFTYNDWSLEVLKQEGGGLIKTKCSASPGVDLDVFKPVPDRRSHKASMGLDPDSFIIGMTARNQKRKLYPDLIRAFAKFIQNAPEELARRTYLYLHTGYPDLGWDIPRLIRESGVSHKIFLTYLCQNCNISYPSRYADAKTACKSCGAGTALLPSSFRGVSREVLAAVTNLFDVYVQYAICEGFGMPQVEAAACGVPVMAVDYSAMTDVVRKLDGYPIAVKKMFRESETHLWRALPDDDDFIAQLVEFLSRPEALLKRDGNKARKAAERFYSWDVAAKVWENHFDSVVVRPQEETWLSPPRLHNPPATAPAGLSNEAFVRWAIANVAGRSDLVNTFLATRMARDLNWGSTTGGNGGFYYHEDSALGEGGRLRGFSHQDALDELNKLNQFWNHWEMQRASALLSNR